MKKIPIIDATDAQLRSFAIDQQQIENVPTARGGIIGALVEAGWTQDYIFDAESGPLELDAGSIILQPEEPTELVHKMPEKGFGFWKGAPMVTCRILPTDRPGGNEPAHPSVNGSPCLVIQRNKLVSIPYDFYLVLKQAGGTKKLPGAGPNDDLIDQDYSEYPMSDVVLPSRQEIAAWNAKVNGIELGAPRAATG